MARNSFNSNTSRTALVGVLTAGSLALLWLACLSPTGRLGIGAAAGLFPIVSVMAAGRAAGYLCWAAGGTLGAVLLPDKGIALLYLLFFGIYPVLKSKFESRSSFVLGWVLKLAYFNAVLALFWFVFRSLFLPHLPAWLDRGWLAVLAGNLVFIVYDIGLSRLIFGLLGSLNPGGRGRK